MSGEASIIPPEELHVVSQDGEHVLFHIPTFNFFTVNPVTADFLRDYTLKSDTLAVISGRRQPLFRGKQR